MDKKKELRAEISRLRDRLTIEDRELLSKLIQEKVLNHPTYQQARTVLYFVSFRSEVDTIPLIRDGLAQQKRVVLPITHVKEGYLSFSELRDFDLELSVGTYGILEPKEEWIRPVSPEEIDLVLTPGLVFDELGYRIGYGGGFYDRFLGGLKKRPCLLALAYDLQVLAQSLPHENYDIPVDIITTEKRLISCCKNREEGC